MLCRWPARDITWQFFDLHIDCMLMSRAGPRYKKAEPSGFLSILMDFLEIQNSVNVAGQHATLASLAFCAKMTFIVFYIIQKIMKKLQTRIY